MQHVKGGIYYVPKEKHSPNDENMIGRPGKPSLTSLHCHSNYPWSPVASDLGEKHPGEKGEPQISTKATFWGKEDATWESRAPCPSLGSAMNGYRGPRVGLCGSWTVPNANATSSCQILGKRQENPLTLKEISTKLQDKGHIQGCTKP